MSPEEEIAAEAMLPRGESIYLPLPFEGGFETSVADGTRKGRGDTAIYFLFIFKKKVSVVTVRTLNGVYFSSPLCCTWFWLSKLVFLADTQLFLFVQFFP